MHSRDIHGVLILALLVPNLQAFTTTLPFAFTSSAACRRSSSSHWWNGKENCFGTHPSSSSYKTLSRLASTPTDAALDAALKQGASRGQAEGEGDLLQLKLEQNDAGIYQINSKEMHDALLAQNPDKLIILKFFAPWCRACKGLAPRFKNVAMQDANQNIVFAELNVQPNRDYVKKLGILALPNVHFYAGSQGVVENFPCGPSKVAILKAKIRKWKTKIDKKTGLLLPFEPEEADIKESEPVSKESIESTISEGIQIKEEGRDEIYSLSNEDLELLRRIPFFKDYSDVEFSNLMKTSTLETFDTGAVIMRQGMPGEKFYVIKEGEVEVAIRSEYEDPLSTPPGYLGAVYNIVNSGNWFGERALITGEPRAASIRTTTVTKCFVFSKANILDTSVLSGKKPPTDERIAQMNEKYGAYNVDVQETKLKEYSVASQSRGSVNSPNPIVGVDVEEDESKVEEEIRDPMDDKRAEIFSLLHQIKLVQLAKMCYDHIVSTKPRFGDKNESYRRSLLLKKVTKAQKAEYNEVFVLIDQNDDGSVQQSELLKVVNSLSSDENAVSFVDGFDVDQTLTKEEFLAIMAEAEFYNLFVNTFNTLDVYNSGFVRGSDINRILKGINDLISDENFSLIQEVGGDDNLINYEQFTKMLLGTKL